MSKVAAECPVCLITDELSPGCMFVEVRSDDEDEGIDTALTWICRTCERLVDVRIDLSTSLTLVAAGAPIVDAAEPETPVGYPENGTGGPPFTWDDLLDFHDYLRSDELAAELFRLSP